MDKIKIVFVGHIDHGKSTLIGRILYDTCSLPNDKIKEIEQVCQELGRDVEFSFILDSLKEEREQNITIDTTQVFFKTEKRDYVIIDTPGHVEFIRNMITGASQADAAVLIIDAFEGIKEQTKRHAYVLSFIGIKNLIVAINKLDLIDYSEEKFNQISFKLREFLKNLHLEPIGIIPVSAKNGENVLKKSENMFWYNGKTILQALDSLEKQKNIAEKDLRFPIQDVYKRDNKRIFVGRIESGSLEESDEIIILPKNKITKVKSIEKFLEKENFARTGESMGITITEPLFIERGNIICKLEEKNLPKITNKIKAKIFWLSSTLNVSEKIILKIATQETSAKLEIIKKINSSTLEEIQDKRKISENETAEITLSCEKKIVIDDFSYCQELGRFVLEKDNNIVAVGTITR